MKVYLKGFELKHLPKFVWEVIDIKTLKNLGFLDPVHWLRTIKESLIEKIDSRALMICNKKEILGRISSVKNKSQVWRAGIFLFKDFRDKGVGEKSIKELLKYAKENGWSKIKADTLNSNLREQKILKKSGFRQLNRIKKTFFEKNLP